jgi:hypothetical protein
LHANGVAAAKVAGIEDVLANPQLAWREYWHPGPLPGNPIPPAKVFAAAGQGPAASPLGRPLTGTLPLEGFVVADFSVYWAGPSCTRMLAELGARVIWVERPGSRDTADPNEPSGNPMDVFYLKMNRRKESLVLDLASSEGRAAARALVARADVLVENNRPGVMDKLGLGCGRALRCESPARLCFAVGLRQLWPLVAAPVLRASDQGGLGHQGAHRLSGRRAPAVRDMRFPIRSAASPARLPHCAGCVSARPREKAAGSTSPSSKPTSRSVARISLRHVPSSASATLRAGALLRASILARGWTNGS